jgi:hypothetical protein
MRSTSLTVGAGDVEVRIRQRLVALRPDARQVIWQSGSHSVLIRATRARARLLRGWLVVRVELQTTQTGRCPVELVYFLGATQQGDGKAAAVRINAATAASTQLAEIWGDDLQRVVWDAVLDVIQLSLRRAQSEAADQPLTLRGFQATPEGIQVDVITGAI